MTNVIFVSPLSNEVLFVEKYQSAPPTNTYADCVQHELLIAEAQNLSLHEVRKVCNNLFIEQTQLWSKTMREDPDVANYVGHLLRGLHAGIERQKKRKKRSIFSSDVYTRKEVREPPYDENWGAYAKAVRRLKNTYDIRPDMSNYDVIAHLHTADGVIPTAHDGPGFFAWHREYLKIMEIALGCPIPYWDTTLDEAMDDPSESCVWSDKYFGNKYGLVTTGIMKKLQSWIPIIRNVNSYGWLISRDDVTMALSKPTLYEFTEKTPCDEANRTLYSWECFHKGIHDWIDGTIAPSNTTTFDPIFFPIHAYIDKIFELFRQQLISKGINPEDNYPVKNILNHEPNHTTIWVPIYPNIEHLTNSQCYGDDLAGLTKYSISPACPFCYGSDDLYCDHERNICVSRKVTTEDKYVKAVISVPTADGGIQLINTVVLDVPERTKELIQRTGPLPFGRKFKAGSPDPRTRNDSIPEL